MKNSIKHTIGYFSSNRTKRVRVRKFRIYFIRFWRRLPQRLPNKSNAFRQTFKLHFLNRRPPYVYGNEYRDFHTRDFFRIIRFYLAFRVSVCKHFYTLRRKNRNKNAGVRRFFRRVSAFFPRRKV